MPNIASESVSLSDLLMTAAQNFSSVRVSLEQLEQQQELTLSDDVDSEVTWSNMLQDIQWLTQFVRHLIGGQESSHQSDNGTGATTDDGSKKPKATNDSRNVDY